MAGCRVLGIIIVNQILLNQILLRAIENSQATSIPIMMASAIKYAIPQEVREDECRHTKLMDRMPYSKFAQAIPFKQRCQLSGFNTKQVRSYTINISGRGSKR